MKSRVNKKHWLITKPIAHRGLHCKGVGENTVSAYARAIENGYPIEMDVQLTADGVLVCFHDDNLKRVTDVDALIWDKTYDEIKDLKVSKTADTIPTFKEFLKFVNGRVPVLIEIKKQRTGKEGIEEKVLDLLKDYNGEYAIQSFDPRIVARIKKLAPDVIRGQLGGLVGDVGISFAQRLVVKYLLLNFLSKPDFINYELSSAPIKQKRPVIYWTVRTEEQKNALDKFGLNYVFENVLPSVTD